MSERISRFSAIVSNASDYNYHIFGCGAIGSNTAISLARMGADKFFLYDDDVVEEANIGISEYDTLNIDESKVIALKKRVELINAYIFARAKQIRITADTKISLDKESISILAFDNMESRLTAAKLICESKGLAMIDGRMGADTFQMYVSSPPNLEEYKNTWYSDEDGDEAPCGRKATTYCSGMSGSFITNAVSKLINELPCPKELLFHFPSYLMETKGEI